MGLEEKNGSTVLDLLLTGHGTLGGTFLHEGGQEFFLN